MSARIAKKDQETFKKRIKKAIRDSGKTQKGVELSLKLSNGALTRAFAGRRSIDAHFLTSLAGELEMGVDEMVKGTALVALLEEDAPVLAEKVKPVKKAKKAKKPKKAKKERVSKVVEQPAKGEEEAPVAEVAVEAVSSQSDAVIEPTDAPESNTPEASSEPESLEVESDGPGVEGEEDAPAPEGEPDHAGDEEGPAAASDGVTRERPAPTPAYTAPEPEPDAPRRRKRDLVLEPLKFLFGLVVGR